MGKKFVAKSLITILIRVRSEHMLFNFLSGGGGKGEDETLISRVLSFLLKEAN
jgi:hypothetical protein